MVTPKQKFIIDTQTIKRKELNIPLYKIIKSHAQQPKTILNRNSKPTLTNNHFKY